MSNAKYITLNDYCSVPGSINASLVRFTKPIHVEHQLNRGSGDTHAVIGSFNDYRTTEDSYAVRDVNGVVSEESIIPEKRSEFVHNIKE